jgi:hypothetical protein
MRATCLFLGIMLIGLFGLKAALTADAPRAPGKEEPVEALFHKALLQAAAEYQTWGRVDDEMRWAPALCRTPNPGRVAPSASTDEETHGKKLYSLFAKSRQQYVTLRKGGSVAVGQVVVKQSWVPEEITNSTEKPAKRIEFEKVVRTPAAVPGHRLRDDVDHFYPYVWVGDRVFKAAKQADLFVMMKLTPETPGTDDGWVYGTVTADGKKVTAAGRIASCMKCHVEAKCDRLFGLGSN